MSLNPRTILTGRKLLATPLRLRDRELPVLEPDASNVPLQRYRECEASRLRELVASLGHSGKTHILAVAGPSGSGKSEAIKRVATPDVALYNPHSFNNKNKELASGKVNIVELPILGDTPDDIQSALQRKNLTNCDDVLFFYPQPLGSLQVTQIRTGRPFEMLLGGAQYLFARRMLPPMSSCHPSAGRLIDKQSEPLLYAMHYYNGRHPEYGEPTRYLPDDDAENAQAALNWTQELIRLLGWRETDMIKLIDAFTSFEDGYSVGFNEGFQSAGACVNAIRLLLFYYLKNNFLDFRENPDFYIEKFFKGGRGDKGSLLVSHLHTGYSPLNFSINDPLKMQLFFEHAQQAAQRLQNKPLAEHLAKPLGEAVEQKC